MVKVSIVVPVYNTEKYLKKCLNSLLNQTLEDIEIIIINDGSPDNSEKVINEFNDKRINYIKQKNSGIGKTRNKGIDIATGKYIVFVDSDDYVSGKFCEIMYEEAEKNKADIVVCDTFKDFGYIKELHYANFDTNSLKKDPTIINKINLGPCNKIYNLKMLKVNKIYFEEKLKYEDAPFVIKAFIHANKIVKIDKCLTYYKIHNNSQTTVRDHRIFDILEICKIIIKEMNNYEYLKNPCCDLLAMILTDYTIQQRYIKDGKERNRFINEAFKLLDDYDKNWRKSSYFKEYSCIQNLIKKSKFFTKCYCFLYQFTKH